MTKSIVTPVVLSVVLASFAVGWRAPSVSTADGLRNPVNMTLADHTLYVSDRSSGVHVFDVSDVAAPRKVTNIALHGNAGTAVKGDILYASDYNSLRVYQRAGDEFTLLLELDSEYDYPDVPFMEGPGNSGYGCMCGVAEETTAPTAPSSASSYATFAVIGDFLYRVDRSKIIVYNITTPAEPVEVGKVNLDWSIETIYPTDQYLFVGGTRGMYICDRTDPASPAMLGKIEHFRACDPVVVTGTTAFVTLRGGNTCGNAPDELLVVDIANPSLPTVVSQTSLSTPYGLAIRDAYLYVSTGANGFSLLDVATPATPAPLASWADWPTRDFLWSENTLFVLGNDDLRIFDVTDPKTPVLQATIENDPS